jgi:hypothetical protein
MFAAEGKQLVVDKLAAIITVDAEQGEGQAGAYSGNIFLDPAVGAVA